MLRSVVVGVTVAVLLDLYDSICMNIVLFWVVFF